MACPHCQSNNLRKLGLNRGRQIYHCQDCWHKHTEGAKHIKCQIRHLHPHPCPQCGEITKKNNFCSQSCAATYNNLHQRQRYETRLSKSKQKYCKYCGVEIDKRRQVCDACNPNIVDWSKVKLGEIKHKAPYQISAVVRQRARMTYRASKRPKYCINCGYDKHYEVCHIRAINDFPLDTTVTTVNDLHNLIALCRNCHWELDHNLVSIEEIRAKNEADF